MKSDKFTREQLSKALPSRCFAALKNSELIVDALPMMTEVKVKRAIKLGHLRPGYYINKRLFGFGQKSFDILVEYFNVRIGERKNKYTDAQIKAAMTILKRSGYKIYK